MRRGDLVVPVHENVVITQNVQPTFSSRGKFRDWHQEQVAVIVEIGTRRVSLNDVLKYRILLDGELWWVGAGNVKPVPASENSEQKVAQGCPPGPE